MYSPGVAVKWPIAAAGMLAAASAAMAAVA